MTRYARWTATLVLGLASAALLAGCDSDRTLTSVGQEPDLTARSSGNGPAVSAPSNAVATASSWNQTNVTWQDNSSNESGFEVQRSTTGPSGAFALVASLGANVTSFGNAGLSGSTQYCYKIRAFRKTGNSTSYSAFSNVACATTPAAPVPATPSNVHAAPQQSNSIFVSWVDNSSNETGFRVERAAASSGPWTTAVTTSSNVTSLGDYGSFAPDQAMCYRVFAVNSYGDSPASNVFCTAVPAVPTNLTATVLADVSVALAWVDNSAVEDSYQIWRTDDGFSWFILATLPANATSYHDATVTPDVTYSYSVSAMKDGGVTDPATVHVVTATTPPAAPDSLLVQPQSSSSVAGTWLDRSSNEAGFRIERSSDGGTSWVTSLTANPNDTSFFDQGLAAEQQVCYRVIAFNNQGDSPPSNTGCTTPPAGPTNLSATAVDALTIDFSWTDNSSVEDGYQLWVYDVDRCICLYPAAVVGPDATTLRYQDQYAYGATAYYIVAVKDGGLSDFSIGVSPPAPPGSVSSVRLGTVPQAAQLRKPTIQRAPAPRPTIRLRGKP